MTYSSMLDHSNPLFRDLELLKLSDIHSLQLLLFQIISVIISSMFLMFIPSALDRQ